MSEIVGEASGETMTVRELKEALKKIPDDYEIKSRSGNAHISDEDNPEDLSWFNVIKKVKVVDLQKTVVFIRSIE